jgi:hypothetical protein
MGGGGGVEDRTVRVREGWGKEEERKKGREK